MSARPTAPTAHPGFSGPADASSASEGASRGPTSAWQGRSSLGADRSGRRAVVGAGLAVAASLVLLVALGSAAVFARAPGGDLRAVPADAAAPLAAPALPTPPAATTPR